MTKVTRWRNWAGNKQCRPVRVVVPSDVEEVVAAVDEARRDDLRVRPVGAGHSFTGIATTDDCLMRTDRLTGIERVDESTRLVTVRGGTPLHQFNSSLDELGLAMPNMGDIDRQTVAGATATGTHGTGATFGGLATGLRALEMVLADGSVVTCSADERPELFAAARVGLGAFGIVTAATLECVPAFRLHAVEEPLPLDRVLTELDAFVDGNEHFEFYWFPHSRVALTKRNNRTDEPVRPVSSLRGWLDDEFLSNSVFGAVNRLCAAVPRLTPAVNNISARALSAREYVDTSHRVFASERKVRFVEMEYAVPRHTVADVLQEIRAWARVRREALPFPVEVRFAAADDIWLSTAYERDTAYVAVHQYQSMPYERYFDAVERIVGGVGGRPHWGKLHGMHAPLLRERYPRFDDFVALRDRSDPQRRFDNPYLQAVLGATTRV